MEALIQEQVCGCIFRAFVLGSTLILWGLRFLLSIQGGIQTEVAFVSDGLNATVEDLASQQAYCFRLVARNEAGSAEGPVSEPITTCGSFIFRRLASK